MNYNYSCLLIINYDTMIQPNSYIYPYYSVLRCLDDDCVVAEAALVAVEDGARAAPLLALRPQHRGVLHRLLARVYLLLSTDTMISTRYLLTL